MNIPRAVLFALAGWVASVIVIVAVGLYWPTIFPAIIRPEHYYGEGPEILSIIGLAIIFGSPAALVGGVIGSRVPKEGGQTEQLIMAGIFGVILALPFACMGLWFFTGW